MRIASTITFLLVLGCTAVSQAQVVSAYRPVGAPILYASSPVMVSSAPVSRATATPSSRVVTAYYQGTQQLAPVSTQTVLQPVISRTIVNSPVDACSCVAQYQTAYYTDAGYSGFVAFRPLLPISPTPGNVVVGRGIIGQPTAYVPGQPVRNFLRYVTP